MTPTSFADLGVSRPVTAALQERGITSPFPIQSLVIADVLAGRDVLAKSPTGSGKTLAFAIPAVETTGRRGEPSVLVLVPTRELASQVVEETRAIAEAKHLTVAPVYGGVGIERQARLARKADIVVATPGRLEDILGRGLISLNRIKMLVLDEADRMLDMGFRPAVDRIVDRLDDNRQTLFFSATLDGEVGRIAKVYTDDPVRHNHDRTEQEQVDVEHRFLPVLHERKLEALVEELQADRELALVFVRTKRGADRLVKRLAGKGVDAVAMHGDKSQSQREKALARFEAGRIDTLVATDVAARGIDVERISHVINFDPPEDREGYVHRIGRTARAGRTGTGITFVGLEHEDTVGKIAATLELHREWEDAGFRPARSSSSTRPRSRSHSRSRSRGGRR